MKELYSFESCLQFFFHLIKRQQIIFSDHQLSIASGDVISICCNSDSWFWANYRNLTLSKSSYQAITRKIRSYLLRSIPVCYLKKRVNFSRFSFFVKKGVLIPQPTTEVLVDNCQEIIGRLWGRKPNIRIFEIGTGVANISISLALSNPFSKIISVDVNRKAFQVAKSNISLYRVKNLRLINSSFFSSLSPDYKFDVIISNPPYIAKKDYQNLSNYTKFQPKDSLVCSFQGYYFFQRIVRESKQFLKDKSLLIFEVGFNQASFVVKILNEQFPKNKIEIFNDLSGFQRVIALFVDKNGLVAQ